MSVLSTGKPRRNSKFHSFKKNQLKNNFSIISDAELQHSHISAHGITNTVSLFCLALTLSAAHFKGFAKSA